MKFPFVKKTKEEKFLALDFSYEYVFAALFSKRKGEKVIEKVAVQPIEKIGVFEYRDFNFEVVKSAVDKIIAKFKIKKKLPKINVIASFPSDELLLETVDVSVKRDKSVENEKISESQASQIYEQVKQKVREKVLDKARRIKSGFYSEDIRIIKEKILEEKILGYNVSSIVGFRGGSLNFKVLVVFCSAHHFNFIEKLKNALFIKKIGIYHKVEGLSNFVKAYSDSPEIFIEVEEKNTNVFLFKKNLQSILSFNLGTFAFSDALSKNLNLTTKERQEIEQRFFLKDLSESSLERIRDIISLPLKEWSGKLSSLVLKNAQSFNFSCRKIFLFSEQNYLEEVKNSIEKSDLVSKLSQLEKIFYLLPNDLKIKVKGKNNLAANFTPLFLLVLVV